MSAYSETTFDSKHYDDTRPNYPEAFYKELLLTEWSSDNFDPKAAKTKLFIHKKITVNWFHGYVKSWMSGFTSSLTVSRKNKRPMTKKVNTLSNYTSRKEESKRKPVEQASSGYHKSASKKGDLEKLFEDEFNDFEDDSVLDNAEPIAVDDNIVNEVEKLEANDETTPSNIPQITSRQQSTEPESLPEKEEEEEITQEVDEDGYIVTSKSQTTGHRQACCQRTFSPASSAAS
ncbi:hypothetical protein G9P44_005141 [Scheffersomyces stipitis]|nr:hypothetical protein G9P44_005141 [Scheffersomyces stipitis]